MKKSSGSSVWDDEKSEVELESTNGLQNLEFPPTDGPPVATPWYDPLQILHCQD